MSETCGVRQSLVLVEEDVPINDLYTITSVSLVHMLLDCRINMSEHIRDQCYARCVGMLHHLGSLEHNTNA